MIYDALDEIVDERLKPELSMAMLNMVENKYKLDRKFIEIALLLSRRRVAVHWMALRPPCGGCLVA